ncbi:hypothetical protein BKA65DRAFT_479633 [Rhexocercosporidium sp. MPI-PUGE-AT-0058]|nr:hypothetical protein BKA65DRAFT_479633 [Rhexocercosporidium sp. MPI-PUGE-AT-0058]
MFPALSNMSSLLIATLLFLIYPFADADSANFEFSSLVHGRTASAQLIRRGMSEIDCPPLRPAATDKHICYLGYQANKRDDHVVVDLSVWNHNCNKIGYATFVPPRGLFALHSDLRYIVMAQVGTWRWDIPPFLDYAGRHFNGRDEDGPWAYHCYYPDENNQNVDEALWKMTRYCLVPFGCEWWVN